MSGPVTVTKTFFLCTAVLLMQVCTTSGIYAQQHPVITFEKSFGRIGSQQGEMNAPRGISAGINGVVYIADTGNNRIQAFTSGGKFLNQVGGFGWDEMQFDKPSAIWAEDGLNVYVADTNNHRIMHFDGNLNFIKSIDTETLQDDLLSARYPVGVSYTSQGELLVIDSENNNVVRFTIFSVPENSFGGYNSTGPPLERPVKIVAKKSDKIYVADEQRKEIVVYDYFGNYLAAYGLGNIRFPAGFDIDEEGSLFVCDKEAGSIVVFDAAGRLSGKFAHPILSAPVDISCAGDTIYVLDQKNASVSVFRVRY